MRFNSQSIDLEDDGVHQGGPAVEGEAPVALSFEVVLKEVSGVPVVPLDGVDDVLTEFLVELLGGVGVVELAGTKDQVIDGHPDSPSPVIVPFAVEGVTDGQGSDPVLAPEDLLVLHHFECGVELVSVVPDHPGEEREETDVSDVFHVLVDVVAAAHHDIFEEVVFVEILFEEGLIVELLLLRVEPRGLGLVNVLGDLLQGVREEVKPGDQIHMLLGPLSGILPGEVIEPTAHEVPILTGVLASPPELDLVDDLLLVGHVVVGLGLLEVRVPLLDLPEIGGQQLFELGVGGIVFDKVLNGEHQGRRVLLEAVLEHELDLRHHGGYLIPPDLLPGDPAEHVDLGEPLVQEPNRLVFVVVNQDHEVESIIPEEASWEDEPGRGGGMCEGLFLGGQGVLGVEGTVVPSDP